MKTNTLKAKLLNCFFAFTLVFGLCIPSIGTYAYAEPTDGIANDTVAAHVEGSDTQGEHQANDVGGDNGTGTGTGNGTGTGDTNNLGDGDQDNANTNDADGNNADNNGTETEVATTQADEIMPMAADATVGSMTISGGTLNTDFTISGTTVVVKTSTPLTLSGTLTNGSIQIQQGASANITLNGATITSNTQSSPINLMGAGTTLRLSLVDGTTNNLAVSSPTSVSCAGIHCGAGSTLYIDDAVANWSNTGTHVEVLNGVVNTAATLENGTSVVQGDPVTRLASSNPGSLIVKGGAASAAIGSGASENSGNMHFDGGVITAYSCGGHANNAGTNANQNYSSGTGIGAGAHGGATNMWFDGATVDAYGSYHGAGVGAGWTTAAGSAQTGTTGGTPNNTCGNIYINAGYLKSQGYEHGNAFGGACGTNANQCIIRITGGTLHPSSYTGKFDIGGNGGYTIVTGGSVYVENKNKFTGVGNTAYNTQGVTTWSDVTALGGSLPDTDKVFMLTVDLSTSSERLNNEKLESFKLYIGGEDAHYGAPTQFENGKLYLWLPEWVAKPNAEKEVRIEMSVRQNDGTIKTIDPLFIAKPSSSDTTQTVKRYIEFDFPADYAKTLEKDYDGLPFPALTVDAQHPINIEREVGGSVVKETLNQPGEVKFKYQMLTQNEEGDWVPTGSESEEGAATLPTDTGKFQVTMTSYQYAKDPNYAASYWGHQAKGVATINSVNAVLTMEGVEWGHLADDGTWTQVTQENASTANAGNRLKLQFNVRSANTTALTCASPTGYFQVSIDGKKVGSPIALTKEGIEASARSTISWPDVTVVSPTGANETRHATEVTYYFDPTNNDALLKALEDASKGGEHKVNVEYIADKNYVQGVDKNPENAKEDDTFIVPVPPTTDVKPDPGDKVVIEDKPTGPTDPSDPSDPDKPVDPDIPTDPSVTVLHKSVTLKYSDYVNKNLGLTFESTSSMPMNCTTSNGAVAELVKDENGNVLGADGKVNLQVNSCGTTRIIMEQSANALYTGTKIILDVTVVPDENIKPQVQIRLITNNLTHPGMPAAPGDEIEYLVTGLNVVKGSAWQTAQLLDVMDPRLEFVEGSVSITNNYATPDVSTRLGTEEFYAKAAEAGFSWNDFDWDSLKAEEGTDKGQYTFDKDNAKVTSSVGSVYGGQSVTMRFVAKLNSGTADRPQNPGDPKDIEPGPGGEGTYGVNENPVPGETPKPPTTLNPDDPKDILVVGDKTTADPENPDDPSDPNNPDNPGYDPNPKDPGDIPPLPIIPKDPVLPGTDPVDPDNPNPPVNPDDPDKVDPDIYVNKTAKNLTHPEGNKALTGDVIAYTITTGNKGKDTCYYWPIIKDELPVGLEPVSGSFELTHVDGTKEAIKDSVYNTQTRTVALYVDDLYGGEEVTLSFQCTVTPEATDIKNTAQVYGTTPSDKWKGEHPDPDPTPEPGKDEKTSYIMFDANGGKGAPAGIEGAPGSEITAEFPGVIPTRKGFTFIGWNTARDGKGAKVEAYPSAFADTPGTILYYAQWKEDYPMVPEPADGDPDPADPTKQAHIAFAANGGTGAPEGISGDTGSKIETAFPTEIPVAPGYKFVGWNTKKDGTGDKVEAYPDTFANTVSTTTYYAQWEKIPAGEPGHDPDKTEPTPDPTKGDPDPIAKELQSYVRFSANGGFFNKNIMTQAAGDEETNPNWSTDGLDGQPNETITVEQKQTFPKKEYEPVYREGYILKGWFTKRTGGDEVTEYKDTLPGSNAQTEYYYAQWEKDPNYVAPDDDPAPKPGDPVNPNNEGKYPWEEPGTPEIDTPEPADVGKVMPADPDYKDLRITLSAKNETRMDGYTYVGDEVTYTILIENLSSPEKSWLDVIARADIPEGLKFIPGSIYLTTPQGEVIHVNDNVYNDVTRILALNAGDLAGGQTVKVVFKAEVTIDAINKDIGMTAKGYGTLPSEFDVEDESYVKPEIGSAFVPEGGWLLYDEGHMSVSNVEKVYPSEYVTAQEHVKGTPEEQAEAAKLAKTGDTTALVALGVGALAIAAGVALVVARRRMKKNDR